MKAVKLGPREAEVLYGRADRRVWLVETSGHADLPVQWIFDPVAEPFRWRLASDTSQSGGRIPNDVLSYLVNNALDHETVGRWVLAAVHRLSAVEDDPEIPDLIAAKARMQGWEYERLFLAAGDPSFLWRSLGEDRPDDPVLRVVADPVGYLMEAPREAWSVATILRNGNCDAVDSPWGLESVRQAAIRHMDERCRAAGVPPPGVVSTGLRPPRHGKVAEYHDHAAPSVIRAVREILDRTAGIRVGIGREDVVQELLAYLRSSPDDPLAARLLDCVIARTDHLAEEAAEMALRLDPVVGVVHVESILGEPGDRAARHYLLSRAEPSALAVLYDRRGAEDDFETGVLARALRGSGWEKFEICALLPRVKEKVETVTGENFDPLPRYWFRLTGEDEDEELVALAQCYFGSRIGNTFIVPRSVEELLTLLGKKEVLRSPGDLRTVRTWRDFCFVSAGWGPMTLEPRKFANAVMQGPVVVGRSQDAYLILSAKGAWAVDAFSGSVERLPDVSRYYAELFRREPERTREWPYRELLRILTQEDFPPSLVEVLAEAGIPAAADLSKGRAILSGRRDAGEPGAVRKAVRVFGMQDFVWRLLSDCLLPDEVAEIYEDIRSGETMVEKTIRLPGWANSPELWERWVGCPDVDVSEMEVPPGKRAKVLLAVADRLPAAVLKRERCSLWKDVYVRKGIVEVGELYGRT